MGKYKSLRPFYSYKAKDRISELPDGVLHNILILSAPNLAIVSTSEISKKFWRCLPLISLTSLSLLQQDPHALSLSDKTYQPGFLEKRAQQFVQRANELLKHYHGKAIEFFKVHFSLNSEHASSIDEWVKFAIEAYAREIVLNFAECLQAPSGKIYKFPYWYFTGTVTGKVPYLKQLTLTKCSFKVPPNSYGLSSLRSLYLKWVKLSNDDVTNLLSCCSRLTWLRLNSCTGFQELTISHTSDELRYLRVDCDRDFDVTISDSNLQTFEFYPYDWYYSDVEFERVPRLSKVSVFCSKISPSASLDTVLTGPISDLYSSLETLFLSLKAPFELPCAPYYYDTFSHLKKLILHIKTTPSVSFLDITSLFKSMPNVEKIHFEIEATGKPQSKKLQKISAEDFLLESLHSIRIGGFRTDPGHIELAMLLVKNAPNLKSLVIDTQKHVYIGDDQWEKVDVGKVAVHLDARRAKLSSIFTDKIPPTVELKVL